MLLRRPHELADLFREGRAREGLSQSDLAAKVGASRQWVSLVENGRTGVAFDLVIGALHALGYRLYVDSPDETDQHDLPTTAGRDVTSHDRSQRTQLTRNGEPLGKTKPGRLARTAGTDSGS